MTRFAFSAVLFLCASLLVEVSLAQEVKIGNGRLLRKWRDDIFGSEKESKSNPGQNNQPTLANPNHRSFSQAQATAQNQPYQQPRQQIQPGSSNQPNQFRQPAQANQRLTPAQRQYQSQLEAQRRNEMMRRQATQQTQAGNRQQQPTSAGNQLDYYRQRSTAPASRNNLRSQTPANAAAAANTQRFTPQQSAPRQLAPPAESHSDTPVQSDEAAIVDPASQLHAQQAAARLNATRNAKRRGPPAVGFGLELKADKNNNLYVSDVDRNGNADNAGIKKGDYIVEVGGIKLGSIEEFDEIVKVMNNGDQLELKVSRRGKQSDVMLTFGEAEEAPEVSTEQQLPTRRSTLSDSNSTSEQQFEFVPPGRSEATPAGPIVNPRAFDVPTPPSGDSDANSKAMEQGVERLELPELELELPDMPAQESEGSVLEID